ncbi:MAG: hypothetical protein IKQ03_01105 [Prevotella sp.]|nr:hypothetical protein [Prevotella sp.]
MDIKANDKNYESLNNPENHAKGKPYLLYDEDGETIITSTAKGINEGTINPFETNMMYVTLYQTEFVKQLLELIRTELIMDVAQAIEDEEERYIIEKGRFINIFSYNYGTGKEKDVCFSRDYDNWDDDYAIINAKGIAEKILDKRRKSEEFRKKIEQLKEKSKEEEIINSYLLSGFSKEKPVNPDSNELSEAKAEIQSLKKLLEEKGPEQAFNATGNECFTKAKMGLLIYAMASICDGPIPIKKRLVPIISAIGGWEEKSVDSEMKKAGFNKKDIEALAKLFEDAMPNFAAEIKKQTVRKPKSKK